MIQSAHEETSFIPRSILQSNQTVGLFLLPTVQPETVEYEGREVLNFSTAYGDYALDPEDSAELKQLEKSLNGNFVMLFVYAMAAYTKHNPLKEIKAYFNRKGKKAVKNINRDVRFSLKEFQCARSIKNVSDIKKQIKSSIEVLRALYKIRNNRNGRYCCCDSASFNEDAGFICINFSEDFISEFFKFVMPLPVSFWRFNIKRSSYAPALLFSIIQLIWINAGKNKELKAVLSFKVENLLKRCGLILKLPKMEDARHRKRLITSFELTLNSCKYSFAWKYKNNYLTFEQWKNVSICITQFIEPELQKFINDYDSIIEGKEQKDLHADKPP